MLSKKENFINKKIMLINMKKRFISIILIFLIILTISGCKVKEEVTKSNEEAPEESGTGVEAGSATIPSGEKVTCPEGTYLMKDSRGVWCADACKETLTFLHDKPTEVQYPCACQSGWTEQSTSEGFKLLTCTV